MTKLTRFIAMSFTLGASVPVGAAVPEAGMLTPDHPTVTWEGSVGSLLFTPDSATTCAAGGCDEFTLSVQLGNGFWGQHGHGAVEVTATWEPYDSVKDLDLFVYDAAGNEVGRSAALDSDTESVFLRDLPDGDYRVIVAPASTFEPQTFRALAQVELDEHFTGPPRDLLPNLVPLKPGNFHVASTVVHLLPFPEHPVLSCYPEETIESETHPIKCLRFDQTIANVGEGALELRFDSNGIATPETGDDHMVQRIFRTHGSRDVRADTYEFHAVHGHIHYPGFGQSRLHEYTWGSGRGDHVRTGNKVGFCVIDVTLLDGYFGGHENGPRSYSPPTCLIPTENEDGTDSGSWQVQGIDVGWADVYGWNLADQYIDITGVADGVYELEQLANPTGSVLESHYGDNTASAIICITGDVVTEVTTADQAAACAA